MIPFSEDSWLRGSTATAFSMSSTITDQLLHSCDVAEIKQLTAWKRYCYLLETMQSSGQKFNQKLMLEAIFRGNDLVYSVPSNCNIS